MDPLNLREVKNLDELIVGFVHGTAIFFEKHGEVCMHCVQQTWHELWTKYLVEKASN